MRPMNEIFNEIQQVGFVVKDVKKIRAVMKALFNVDPIESRAGIQKAPNAYYYGEPAEFSADIVHYDFGSIELEFIQPLTGENVWKDHLDQHGTSIHHIMFNVKSCEEAQEALGAHGIKPAMRGDSTRGGGHYWTYYKLEDLGCYLEIVSGRIVGQKK